MSKTLKIVIMVAAALVFAGGFLVAGFLAGRVSTSGFGFMPQKRMYNRYNDSAPAQQDGWRQSARGMNEYCDDNWNEQSGRRDKGSRMFGNSNQGGWGCHALGTTAVTAEPLSLDDAKTAVQDYVSSLNNDDLSISEVMIFDNQAYARVIEKSTGLGAMELLVDNATRSVYPEHGANMMWNQKYGRMAGRGMMGSGMRGLGNSNLVNPTVQMTADMSVSAEEALKIAQDYLDKAQPGEKAGEAEPFYGYYTLDILKDGKVTGMLSVNGFSGQLLVHTWHGTFIEMSEED